MLERLRHNSDLPGAWLRSMRAARELRPLYEQIETYSMFIGHPRSGHTLVGSMLDAHPEAVIAHELDALRYFQAGFSQAQVFALILEKQRAESWWSAGYQYLVPDQWQGRYETLRVIGDKKGGVSTRRVLQHPRLLDRVQRRLRVPMRLVAVVRNPFDNITTMERYQRGSLRDAVDDYFLLCRGVEQARRTFGESLLILRHEDLLLDGAGFLRRLCGFLGIEPRDDWLDACTGMLFDSPHRTRESAAWTDDLIEHVVRRIDEFDFLRDYAFDS